MTTNTELLQPQIVPEALIEITEQDVDDFARLLPQLSSSERTDEQIARNLHAAVSSTTSKIFVIRDEHGRIQATATGNTCPIPTGNKAWVDDVVTDQAHRGKGWGGLVTAAAEEWFAVSGISSSNLTSRPSRGTARNLYEATGYVPRDTTVFRKMLGMTAVQSS